MNLPTVAVPIGILLSPFKTKIEKYFFLDTYLASHREYLKREGFLGRWEDIGSNLEVSMAFPSILDNDRVPKAHIAVRSKEKDKDPIDHLSLLIEAESPVATYQETVTLYRVSEKPVIAALPSIPLRGFYLSDDGKLIESVGKVRIFLVSSNSDESKTNIENSCVYTTRPNVVDLLNQRFEERWGTYWNMAAIDSAIRDHDKSLNYHLVVPKVLYGSSSKIPFSAHVKGVFRALIGKPLYWILTRSWLLKGYFWIPILVGRRKWQPENR